jgi:uncharacterized membrane protein (DUF2068 family)
LAPVGTTISGHDVSGLRDLTAMTEDLSTAEQPEPSAGAVVAGSKGEAVAGAEDPPAAGAAANGNRQLVALPGTERMRRFRPKLRYELVGCGLHGHELVGTDAREIRPEDHLVVREADGLRWYRCLRCDSWLPLSPPVAAPNRFPPDRDEIELPLRGGPLRDRFVLRLIAADRVIHFLVLGAISVAIFVYASNQANLRGDYTKILNSLESAFSGLASSSHRGILGEINKLASLSTRKLYLYGSVFGIYAVVNGIEAFGLWWAKRWAEYLTLIEVTLLLPLELYELTIKISYLKIITLIVNLFVVAYLLWAHRLFGVRGGGRADDAEREHDSGWPALERATPVGLPVHPHGADV